jgi:hypothetical protein
MAGEDERGVTSRGLVTDPVGTVAAAAGRAAKTGAAVLEQLESPEGRAKWNGIRLAVDLIEYLETEESPSFKILLVYWLQAGKAKGLPDFARMLHQKPHQGAGTYLSLFFVIIHARASRELAEAIRKTFEKAGVLIIPIRSSAKPSAPAPIRDAVEGVGLAERFVFEGRTLVRLGGEEFYVSGVVPEGVWTPPRGSTSVLYIYKASQPRRMYRLDFGRFVPKGGSEATEGWHHNVDRVGKILKIEGVNHTPASGWGKATGRALRIFKYAGRPLMFIGATTEVVEIYKALDQPRESARAAGRIAGGVGGAAGGAALGVRVGRLGGPYGAAAGFVIGLVVGGISGAALGEALADWGYCLLFTPLEAEEWLMLSESEVTEVETENGQPKPSPQPAK